MEDKEERRMSAYYYSFDLTGVDCIDDILSAVATAGKMFHDTECWIDPIEWMPDSPSCRDLIQEAACAAARIFNERYEQGRDDESEIQAIARCVDNR